MYLTQILIKNDIVGHRKQLTNRQKFVALSSLVKGLN